ncbi:MAG: efflux transporter outer membrane subunit [Proteobacteria bacterium]|nr:efflux transporter outer membrane subunit [Pseudomonadota bacterium]
MSTYQKFFIGMTMLALSACAVGPDYVKPKVTVPVKYKEAPKPHKNWKVAQPNDSCNRGEWWKVFRVPELNELESQLNISNQTIATAEAQYRQARALVDEARAAYFPTIATAVSVTKQRSSQGFLSSGSSSSSSGFSGSASAKPSTFYSGLLSASWEPDIWGAIRRTVEASHSAAQASAAQVGAVRLVAQASLAQFYFELRALDKDQKLLDNTVNGYRKTLQLTMNRYASGVDGQANVIQARSQLETAEALAINNGILRAQYEHAIAVLIGKPPSIFSLSFKPLAGGPPSIPVELPSVLLERRPDIAQAERLMAQANAQVGIAIAAYFPVLTLSGTGSAQSKVLKKWFDLPALGWSIGSQIAETIFDGGLRAATTAAARANYDATVASYRQVVLAAFQDVEDNLVALRILTAEEATLKKAAADARAALQIVINQYESGTAAYSDVLTAQIAAYAAEKSAADVTGLRMTAAVGLIRSLGGGWDAASIDRAASTS